MDLKLNLSDDFFYWVSTVLKIWSVAFFLFGIFLYFGVIEGEVDLSKLAGLTFIIGAFTAWSFARDIAKSVAEKRKEDEMECETEWKL